MNFTFLLIQCIYPHCFYDQRQNKLRVLFFLRDPNNIDIRAFIRNQIVGFVERGHDVCITYYKNSTITTVTSKFLEGYNLKDKTLYYEDLLKQPQDFRRYDVIICHSGSEYAHHILDLCKQKKLSGKLVSFFRGWDLTWVIRENINEYIQLFQEADLFLAVCDYLKEYAIKLGCPAHKIAIQFSGIDCQQFKYCSHEFSSNDSINLITVTSGGLRKGLLYMIQAAAKVIARNPNVKFIIVGPHDVKNVIEELPPFISKNIITLGILPHDNIPEILEQGHIFIAASVTDEDGRQEGISTALKEAMACGLPIISTYHAGIPELVKHGKSGLLVNERDTQALTQQIEYLINNPVLCLKMGQEARRVIEIEHNIDLENEKFEKIIFNLVTNDSNFH